MQRIEKHYNELKNQFQSLQNAKNKLAKSQPYEVQRWSKVFLEQGILSRHQQEKHTKRKLLFDDEDLKLVACIWLYSVLPKDCFLLALKKELKTNIFSKLLGVLIIISKLIT
ncbi:hypothetical protein F8M41_018379 [Gigaspora margarita]|uniref:Uncharacterized protein n=1 Tax=Gigaspora margarita TaxID=4874 RepID=A0A8H3WRM8_GIGMA|nr:hypothetical protein F8M41_018379 [Gigaspora margarita]